MRPAFLDLAGRSRQCISCGSVSIETVCISFRSTVSAHCPGAVVLWHPGFCHIPSRPASRGLRGGTPFGAILPGLFVHLLSRKKAFDMIWLWRGLWAGSASNARPASGVTLHAPRSDTSLRPTHLNCLFPCRLPGFRPGACGSVRPFRGYPSHASDTPPIGDCRGPRSVGAGPFRSHGRGRPCRPQAPGLQPIKWRGLLLPDSSPRPSAGSRRSQNDSCGQFACITCHEMKKTAMYFHFMARFPGILPKTWP